MTTQRHPAIEQWLTDLQQNGVQALSRLLFGQVWLAGFAGTSTGLALPQFFPQARIWALDEAMEGWFTQQLHAATKPDGISAKQYAQALCDALLVLQALDLPRTRSWCQNQSRVLRIWRWLKSQSPSPAFDPRPLFLRAIALHQPNRDLLSFWSGLCQQAHTAYADLALFGLRQMPMDDAGNPETKVPRALINGLLDHGRVLAQGLTPNDEPNHKKGWLKQVDFLTAVYPQTADNWKTAFRRAHAARPLPKPVVNWLDTRFPKFDQIPASSQASTPLHAPYWKTEIQPLLDNFEQRPAQTKQALDALMDKHRLYAQETGDSYFLVRGFCRLGRWLLKNRSGDAAALQWGQDLVTTAASWAPADHHTWGLMARLFDRQGEWTKASAVFWYARRRFPFVVQAHTQLGHALAMRGEVDAGIAVYQQAIQRFPENPFCYTDYAHTLRVASRLEESCGAYRAAKNRFHDDQVVAAGLTAVLIELGRAQEAEDELAWARHVSDDSDKQQRVLADLNKRMLALQAGKPVREKTSSSKLLQTNDGLAGLNALAGLDFSAATPLGEATLWRSQAGTQDLDKARALLDALPRSLERDVEQGLWLRSAQGWAAAEHHFAQLSLAYPGDGVVQVHHQRARARAALESQANPIDDDIWYGLERKFEAFKPITSQELGRPVIAIPAEIQTMQYDAEQQDDPEQLDHPDYVQWWKSANADVQIRDKVQEDFLASVQLA